MFKEEIPELTMANGYEDFENQVLETIRFTGPCGIYIIDPHCYTSKKCHTRPVCVDGVYTSISVGVPLNIKKESLFVGEKPGEWIFKHVSHLDHGFSSMADFKREPPLDKNGEPYKDVDDWLKDALEVDDYGLALLYGEVRDEMSDELNQTYRGEPHQLVIEVARLNAEKIIRDHGPEIEANLASSARFG